jgi:hypothetical protein
MALDLPIDGQFEAPLVGTDDAEFFRTHGWWIASRSLPEELVDELAYGVQRYLAGERDTPLPMHLGTDWNPSFGNVVRQGDYASLQVDELYRFVRDPTLPEVASMLSGSRSIRVFHDQIVYKPPMAPGVRSTVGWYADGAYWRACTSEHMLTAWVALQDTPLDMGPLAFWDRSHVWPGIEELHTFDNEELVQIERLHRIATTMTDRTRRVEDEQAGIGQSCNRPSAAHRDRPRKLAVPVRVTCFVPNLFSYERNAEIGQ